MYSSEITGAVITLMVALMPICKLSAILLFVCSYFAKDAPKAARLFCKVSFGCCLVAIAGVLAGTLALNALGPVGPLPLAFALPWATLAFFALRRLSRFPAV